MKTEIKNLKETAERIKKAVTNNERIILYGDSDLDGISSTVILEETIKNLGGKIFQVLFPNREEDGYGINKKALAFVKDKASALFITLDLGISNNKEIEFLNEFGFSVIVVDHHQILRHIPNAQIVVDPQQSGDTSEYKYLANAGLTFKLAKEILGQGLSENLKNSFLELTALATISDMVPQVGENKMFIEEGLRSLKNTFRPGLRAFLYILGEGEVLAGGFYKLISALNAAESMDFKNDSYELLTSPSKKRCMELAQELVDKTVYKQMKIKEVTEEVERRITQKPDEPIIFEGDPAWKLVLAGPVASIVYVKHNKPTFIFKKGDAESSGSVRSPQGKNSVEAMKSCEELLITYGGHPQASGFRLKNENLEKFKDGLIKYFAK
ncbi:MAG TPA: DHH family phosphoesterase [Candidatus Paceibacterota bacterium]